MNNEVISRFREKPKTKIAWRAMWLGLAALFSPPFLGTFAGFIRPMIDEVYGENIGAAVGFGVAFLILGLVIVAFVTGARAYRKGERSWVLWVGFAPAILAGIFWVFMIIGEFIFQH